MATEFSEYNELEANKDLEGLKEIDSLVEKAMKEIQGANPIEVKEIPKSVPKIDPNQKEINYGPTFTGQGDCDCSCWMSCTVGK